MFSIVFRGWCLSLIFIFGNFYYFRQSASAFSVNLALFSDNNVTNSICKSLSSNNFLADNSCNLMNFGGGSYYIKVDCASNTITSSWSMRIYVPSVYQCSLDSANYLVLSGSLAGDSCATAAHASYSLYQQFLVRCDGSAVVPTALPTRAPTYQPSLRPSTSTPSSSAPIFSPLLSYAATITSFQSETACSLNDLMTAAVLSTEFDSKSVPIIGNCSILPLYTFHNDSSNKLVVQETTFSAIVHCYSTSKWVMYVYNASSYSIVTSGVNICTSQNLLFSANQTMFASSSSTSCQRLSFSGTYASQFVQYWTYYRISCDTKFRSAIPTVSPSRLPTVAPTTRTPTTSRPSISLRPTTFAPSYSKSHLAGMRIYVFGENGGNASDVYTSINAEQCTKRSHTAMATLQTLKDTCISSNSFSSILSSSFNTTRDSASVNNVSSVLNSNLKSLSVRCAPSNIGGNVYPWRVTLYTADNCFSGASNSMTYTFYGKDTCACPVYSSFSDSGNNAMDRVTFTNLMSNLALQVDCDQNEPTNCDIATTESDSSESSSKSGMLEYVSLSPVVFILIIVGVGIVVVILLVCCCRRYYDMVFYRYWLRFLAGMHYLSTSLSLNATQWRVYCATPCVQVSQTTYAIYTFLGGLIVNICTSLYTWMGVHNGHDSGGGATDTGIAEAELVSRLMERDAYVTVEEVATWNIVPLVITQVLPLNHRHPFSISHTNLRNNNNNISSSSWPLSTSNSSVHLVSSPVTVLTPPMNNNLSDGHLPNQISFWDVDSGTPVSWQTLYNLYCLPHIHRNGSEQTNNELDVAGHNKPPVSRWWPRGMYHYLPSLLGTAAGAPIYSEDISVPVGHAVTTDSLFASQSQGNFHGQQEVPVISVAVRLAPLNPSPSNTNNTTLNGAVPSAANVHSTNMSQNTTIATNNNSNAISSLFQSTNQTMSSTVTSSHNNNSSNILMNFTASFARLPFVNSWRIVPTRASLSATHPYDDHITATHPTVPHHHHADTNHHYQPVHQQHHYHYDPNNNDYHYSEGEEQSVDENVVHTYDEHADDIESFRHGNAANIHSHTQGSYPYTNDPSALAYDHAVTENERAGWHAWEQHQSTEEHPENHELHEHSHYDSAEDHDTHSFYHTADSYVPHQEDEHQHEEQYQEHEHGEHPPYDPSSAPHTYDTSYDTYYPTEDHENPMDSYTAHAEDHEQHSYNGYTYDLDAQENGEHHEAFAEHYSYDSQHYHEVAETAANYDETHHRDAHETYYE